MSPLVVLMLGLIRFLSPRCGLSLCLRTVGAVVLPSQPLRPLFLSSSSSNDYPSNCLVKHSRASNKIKESRRRLSLASAMATCSSVIFNGSAEPKGARAQDLVRPSTKAYLVESPRSNLLASGELPIARDPSPSLKAERSPDRHYGDDPLIPMPLEEEAKPLEGGRSRSHVLALLHAWMLAYVCPRKKSPRSQRMDLSCLSLNPTTPLLFAVPVVLGRNLLLSGLSALKGREHFPCLLYTKQKEVRLEPKKKPDKGAMLSTLRIILKDKEARGSKEKPIEGLPIARLDMLAHGLLARFHYLGHEGWDRLRMIICLQVILKVASGFGLFCGWLPKWAAHRLSIIPVRKVPPTCLTAHEKKSYFQFFTLDFFSMAII
ncbi:LOW QUALITY PROTEIN: hypothetical protein Cgig2_015565 [Carnegiea gigantea]|uniref:Uncharacterized protein n=1 Tax=Carnegiea gigantea TaxID=171969 RepID=A0A9Q1QBR0_9CARY|nr:LOW QUALITY PROTEIN: hypothetical protein Cgig2_015565 [Carnegiea gigantea]